MRYEVYDSYTPYSELDSKIQEIIRTQTNGLYISYESTGLSTDGKDVMEVIVARDKAVVDNYLAPAEAGPDRAGGRGRRREVRPPQRLSGPRVHHQHPPQ